MPIKKQHHKKHPKKRDEGKEKEHGQKNEGKEQHDVEGKEDHHHKDKHHGKGHHGKGHHGHHHGKGHHTQHGDKHHHSPHHHKKHHGHHHKHKQTDENPQGLHHTVDKPYENIKIAQKSSINLNKVQENNWSLQCDRLLVFGQGYETKLQAWEDIHKKIMKIHPKGTMLTLDETKKRYETLITKNKFIPRVELLRLSIEDEVLRKGVGVAASYGVTEPVIRKIADDDGNGKESRSQRDGNLKIKCVSKKSRGRDVAHILGIKQQLERTSPLLSAVLKQERDKLNNLLPGGLSADPCLRYDAKNRTLEIHENCREFKDDETYGFCEKNVVEKYLIFCEDSSILHRFKENRKIEKEFTDREKIVNHDMERSLKFKMNNVLDDLQKNQKLEIVCLFSLKYISFAYTMYSIYIYTHTHTIQLTKLYPFTLFNILIP